MKIVVNDENLTLAGTLTLAGLLEQLSRHQPGTALAVNQQIIPAIAGPLTYYRKAMIW